MMVAPMSVFTHLTSEDIQSLCAKIDAEQGSCLGKLRSVTPMSNGFLNSVYAIETDTGHYIFRVLEESEASFMFADHAERWKAQQHLFANGAPVPEPVAALSAEGMDIRIERKVLGHNPSESEAMMEAHRMGEALARFHLAGMDAPDFYHQLPGIGAIVGHEIKESVKRWSPYTMGQEVAFWRDAITTVPERIKAQRYEATHRLPSGLVHGDLNLGNWLLDHASTTIIDFDTLHKGCLAKDVAQLLYHISVGAEQQSSDAKSCFVPEVAQAAIAGYQSVRTLSQDEQAYLPIALKEYGNYRRAARNRLLMGGRDIEPDAEARSAAVIDFCNRGDVSALFPNTTHEAPTPDAAAKGWLPTLRDAVPFLRDRERHAA
jgi:homoserine kinase type II